MRVVYAMRLDGPAWSPDHTATVRSMVTDWVEEEHPFAERGPGITVRFDNADPERWWRLTVDRGLADKAVATSTVTIATDSSGTSFEVRTVVIPGGHRIQPTMPDVPIASLKNLVAGVLDAVPMYDANTRVLGRVRVVKDTLGAQEIAAFCDAPGRRLPILVETVPTQSSPLFDIESVARSVVGQVHLVRFEGDATRTAFHQLYRDDFLLARGLALVWPGREHKVWGGGGLTQAGAGSELRNCIGLLGVAANGSLAPLRAPRFRRRSDDAPVVVTTPVATEAVATDAVAMSEYRAALDGWQEAYNRIDELEQALAEADRTIDEKNQLLEKGDFIVDQLVLQNTELAIRLGKSPSGLQASSAIDAVRQAASICEHLTFHARALETAAQLENVDANRLLEDLVRLNVVAGDWKSGRITKASLTISCRSLGLNYAGGISDTAERKYSDDYAFTWRGRTEYAVAHIRNGKGARLYRVHVFFDDEVQQVVVAYVGRHLRDKSTN
ncbi:MAG: hypothetical protein RIS41_1028 [Actinomycetota bacterium]|jgi:uncharacterized coiled-coil protein SlyX